MTPQEPAMGVSDEAVQAAQGKMIAQITNPEAWPPGYADGFNDAAKLCFEEIPAALLAALPHMRPAGEAVAWQRRCSHKLPNGEYCDWSHATKAEYDRWLARDYPDTLWEYRALVVRATTPPQPSAELVEREARELLAQQYDRECDEMAATALRGGLALKAHKIAIRAIIAALTRREVQQEARKGALDELARENERLGLSYADAPQREAPGAVDSGSRLNQLWNGMYRMFNHGRENNTVSAQCEVQMLPAFLAGKDITAWNHPVPKTDTTQPAPVDVRVEALRNRFLSDTSSLPEEWQDWREDFRRDIQALLDGQPSADAGDADEERLLGPWEEHFGRAYIDASCVEGVWTHPDHVFEFIEKRARELHDAAIAAQREADEG